MTSATIASARLSIYGKPIAAAAFIGRLPLRGIEGSHPPTILVGDQSSEVALKLLKR